MNDDAPNLPVKINPRGAGLPDAVRQLAFETWAWRAGRSIDQTLKTLADELAPNDVPSRRTLERWKADEDWPTKAARAIAENAPQTLTNYMADFFDSIGDAQQAIRESLSIDVRDKGVRPGLLAAKSQSAHRLWELFVTMHQAGQTDLAAKPKRTPGQPVDPIHDASERARRLRDRIAKGHKS